MKRQMITEGKAVPPKIAALLDDPIKCGRIAAAWEVIKEIGVAVLFELPAFCKDRELDPSATVVAANRILTTMEVFKDQAEFDRKNAPNNENADTRQT